MRVLCNGVAKTVSGSLLVLDPFVFLLDDLEERHVLRSRLLELVDVVVVLSGAVVGLGCLPVVGLGGFLVVDFIVDPGRRIRGAVEDIVFSVFDDALDHHPQVPLVEDFPPDLVDDRLPHLRALRH